MMLSWLANGQLIKNKYMYIYINLYHIYFLKKWINHIALEKRQDTGPTGKGLPQESKYNHQELESKTKDKKNRRRALKEKEIL